MAQEPRTADDLVHLITEYNLPRECIPTQYLQSPEIWSALLPGMPMTAMIRNLGKMTAVGILGPGSPGQHLVVEALTNQDRLKKARIHPIAILSAMKVYQQGTGVRGSLTWRPNRTIVDALDDAFYASFGNVTPTGLRTLVALDVSGSMTYQVNGLPHLSCREAAAAMSLVVAKTEQNWEIHGFTSALGAYSYSSRFSRDYTAALEGFIELDISPRQRLDDVVRTTGSLPFGGTDCALPMLWAQKNSREFDAIHIITDNETWAGTIHPVEALRNYRQASGLPTKLVVWGMASNGFSIADPRDGGMMDIVGLDAAAPNLANDFLRS
jgi:60 kDa SS-A/Ro ribonucleoprotein